MKHIQGVTCGLEILFLCLIGFSVSLSAQSNFSFTLSSAGVTSVGIYDSNNQLVKTIFGAQQLSAGTYAVTWDGLDNLSDPKRPVSPGTYTWKVAVNGNVYSQGVQLGNTGIPTTTSGHVPPTSKRSDGFQRGHLQR